MVIDRIELAKRMDVLTAENCEDCPNKNLGTSACEGCKVFEELTRIGNKFTEEVQTRRKKKRVPLNPAREYRRNSKSAVKIHNIKKYKDKRIRDKKIEEFIIDNHKEMSMNRMAELLGVTFPTVKSRMEEMGLKSKGKPSYTYIYLQNGTEKKRGSIKEIAAFADVATETVYGWFYRKGKSNEIKRIRKVE